MSKPTVFISYSHKDEEWKDRLVTQLGVLQAQGSLTIWEDRKIEGGDDWRPKIEQAINQAHIAVLLISANFLTSQFILGKEVPELLRRREKEDLRIMPLIVKPCAWSAVDWLAGIQARPKDGRALSGGSDFQIDTDLAAFAEEIHTILRRVPTQPPPQTDDQSAYIIPPEKIDLSKLPVTSPNLFGRKEELELLDEAWENSQTKVLSFIAWGGVGKSALINGWLNKMGEQHYRGAERVYGWSFYSQGTKEKGQASADQFINDALNWFGHKGEIPKSQHDKGRLLAESISQRKTLLILDGLEPLQYPPGPMYGSLQDQSITGLLKHLVRSMNGLCIITSRCTVKDLQVAEGRASRTKELGNLSDDAGKALLKSYHLKGPEKEFIETTKDFKGHALALHLLGSYLNAIHNSDLRKRDLIPKLTEDENNGGHARRVMASYENWFAETNKAELDVLNLLGLFDRPATKAAIDVLKKEPPIKGLTERLQQLSHHDWQLTLSHLRDLRLIAEKDANEPDTLDCHPLIREHFGEKLQTQNPDAWKAAHARLYDYYKNLPKKELPDTLKEMEPLFAAVTHGCLAGNHQAAMDDVYWERIVRSNEAFIVHKLGALGAWICCLASFFETPWDKPASGLAEADKAVTLGWAGTALWAVGRLSEAAQPMEASLEMLSNDKDWKRAAAAASNLSELYLTLGKVASAENYGAQSVSFADRSGDGFEMVSNRSNHADALHQAGKNLAAENLFREAETMRKKRLPEYPYLFSLSGFYFCDLLLSMGNDQAVLERARMTIKIAEENHWLLDIGLDNLSIGKALLLQLLDTHSSDPSISLRAGFTEASENLNQAVDGLREAGTQHHLPLGLLARATLFRHQKAFPKAWADLTEAHEIVTFGQMRLHLTDYHLEAARLIQAQLAQTQPPFTITEDGVEQRLSTTEMTELFKTHVSKAANLIQETGYHRRDAELAALQETL